MRARSCPGGRAPRLRALGGGARARDPVRRRRRARRSRIATSRAQRMLVDGAPHPEIAAGRAFESRSGRARLPSRARGRSAGRAVVHRLPGGARPRPPPDGAWTAGRRSARPSSRLRSSSPPPRRGSPSRRVDLPPTLATASSPASRSPRSPRPAYLGLTGRQELSDLRSTCAPYCTDAQVEPGADAPHVLRRRPRGRARRRRGDALSLRANAHSERALVRDGASLEIAPTPGGAAALIGGRF